MVDRSGGTEVATEVATDGDYHLEELKASLFELYKDVFSIFNYEK